VGFSSLSDLTDTAKRLEAELGPEVESTACILGHGNEYSREDGWMRWRCLTKINAFIASAEGLEKLPLHDVPMTKLIFDAMTKANCPQGETARQLELASGRTKQYRRYRGFFGYNAQVVHVDCKNVAEVRDREMKPD
jgi:hypothetical protein